MMNEQNITDLIRARTSVRTYSGREIEPDKRAAMEAFLKEHTDNPFGADVRFALLDKQHTDERIGTYGMIRGPKVFFAGCAAPGPHSIEGFGYVFERAVLFAQSLGLSTCWLGGTLSRGEFEKALNAGSDEILPAASPLGYAAGRRSVMDRITAAGAGARKRKAFGELFFDGGFGQPLQLTDGALQTCLEMVRIGPSASNKQPWRAVKQGDALHFYLLKTPGYTGNKAFGFCMQQLDMGIAACHFELTAKERGLPGRIMVQDPKLPVQAEGIAYSFSWG